MAARVFLIDGTAFCYRAFYALPPLSAPDGRPTNAVYGFAMMVQALRNKEHPDALAVAFDAGKPTFRHEAFEGYKRHRKPMPEELIAQLPLVQRLLEAHRIPIFACEGYEGEDVLASIARTLSAEPVETLLVTGDKDVLQLVNSHLKVYNPHTAAVWDAAAVEGRYGLRPDQMVDLMALMGDDTDNIPGVPGIGEKTAVTLLKRFGSVEGVYRGLAEVEGPSRRHQLEESRDQVAQARELARVRDDVPLSVTLSAIRVQEPDWATLRAFYRELGFTRLLGDVEARAPVVTAWRPTVHRAASDAGIRQLLECAGKAEQPPAVLCWPVHQVSGIRCQVSKRGGQRAGDEEMSAGVLVAIAPSASEAWVTTLEGKEGIPAELRRWMEEASAPKIGHDAKGTMRLLDGFGVRVRGIVGDTMLAAHLLNPGRDVASLSEVVSESLDEWLGVFPQKICCANFLQRPSGRGILLRADSATPSDQPPEEEWAAFGRWACAAWRVHRHLLERLETFQLRSLYLELELPLIEVLAGMERAGVAVDRRALSALRASMQAALSTLAEEIQRLAGAAFNLNSPKQLAQVLFERLQLPVVKRTKTGPSTDSEVLAALANRHPLPACLIRYRELSKLVSTYVEALPKLIAPETGRLHTTFHQAQTATGRLSSSNPNLQNIPIKTELGRSIRKAFVPGIPDGVLVAADYSQIELRILAHCSGDAGLIEAFRRGADIHRSTASLVYGCPESEVQPEQRQAMKAINFGILYGMTAHGLSRELGMTVEEAQAFIDAYFQRYPTVREYLDRLLAKARRDGFVQTLLGRRRYLPDLAHDDAVIRQAAERMALNAPIQGTAADLIKRAMIHLQARLGIEGLTARMVLQVHDELVFEAPRRELPRLAPLVRQIMEGALTLSVPLVVTIKAGPNWLDLVPVEN